MLDKLKGYLDENQVRYQVISHSRAYTAQEIAALVHIPGQEMAKTVIVQIHGSLAMLVLPASYHVDFTRLANALGTGDVYLASEEEFRARFPQCETGAMPPFGNLFEVPVYVAQSLSLDEEIFFNAGNHTELVRMRYADFARLVQPKVISFTTRLPSDVLPMEAAPGQAASVAGSAGETPAASGQAPA